MILGRIVDRFGSWQQYCLFSFAFAAIFFSSPKNCLKADPIALVLNLSVAGWSNSGKTDCHPNPFHHSFLY